jgi:hypothetical protein
MDTANPNTPAGAPESGIRQPAPDGRPASACSELTVGKLRDWLNDLRSQNWRDKDYSAAIVREQDALARIMDHYDFCRRIKKITQNDQVQELSGGK